MMCVDRNIDSGIFRAMHTANRLREGIAFQHLPLLLVTEVM